MIDHVAVIVPAHNEEAEIDGCLRAVLAAIEHAATLMPQLEMRIVAVADDCSDGTVAIIDRLAAAHPVITPLAVPFGTVGAARDAAGKLALRVAAGDDPAALSRMWVAFTDADSRVPRNWITAHVTHAEAGADCVVGTVEPRAESDNADLVRAWFAAHELGEGHDHVFGANLGIRGSVFDRLGGCPRIPVGEDVALVAAVIDAGGNAHRTDDCRVITSARMRGRCHGGFSTFLQGLV